MWGCLGRVSFETVSCFGPIHFGSDNFYNSMTQTVAIGDQTSEYVQFLSNQCTILWKYFVLAVHSHRGRARFLRFGSLWTVETPLTLHSSFRRALMVSCDSSNSCILSFSTVVSLDNVAFSASMSAKPFCWISLMKVSIFLIRISRIPIFIRNAVFAGSN
jgi:hypothetical protein